MVRDGRGRGMEERGMEGTLGLPCKANCHWVEEATDKGTGI